MRHWKRDLLIILGVGAVLRGSSSLLLRILTLVVLAAIGAKAWSLIGPSRPSVAPDARVALDALINERIPGLLVALSDIGPVAVLQLDGDHTLYATDQIRARVGGLGTLNLLDRTTHEKTRIAAHLPIASYSRLEQAVARAEELRANRAVYGSISSHVVDGSVRFSMDLRVADAKTGQDVPLPSVSGSAAEDVLAGGTSTVGAEDILTAIQNVGSGESNHGRSTASSGWLYLQRLALWLLACLVLPVMTVNFLRVTVRRESNTANAAVLAGYILGSAILYALLVGVHPQMWASWLQLITGLTMVGIYYVAVMSRIADPLS